MNDFKVGDWVKPIYGKSFKQILEVDNSRALETFILIPEGLAPTWFNAKWFTKWQPQEGEWCWFMYKDRLETEVNSHWRIPTLGRFGEFENGKVKTIESFVYDICEPFIGELPSFIKKH